MRVGGAAGRMHVYQRLIEMLVESASLYSAVLVILVVLEARNELAGSYIEDLAIILRVRPTRFDFSPCDNNVSSRELCQQFLSAALQQDTLGQTTPGAIIPPHRQFGSEIIQVRRMTVK